MRWRIGVWAAVFAGLAACGTVPSGRPPEPQVDIARVPVESLTGQTGAEIETLLGEPALIRREREAQVWQYAAEGCVLLFYLYPDAAGAVRVKFLESTEQSSSSDEPGGLSDQSCLEVQQRAHALRALAE